MKLKTANEILMEKRSALVDGVPRGATDGDLSGDPPALTEGEEDQFAQALIKLVQDMNDIGFRHIKGKMKNSPLAKALKDSGEVLMKTVRKYM